MVKRVQNICSIFHSHIVSLDIDLKKSLVDNYCQKSLFNFYIELCYATLRQPHLFEMLRNTSLNKFLDYVTGKI